MNGTGALMQPQAPVPEPQPVMQQSPMLIMGGNAPRPNTVLSQPGIQARAGELANTLMGDIINGKNEKQQRDFAGSKIFGGASAILGGLMGGGYAQGGLHTLEQVNQHIAQAKTERAMKQRDAWTGLNTVMNFVNSTSPDSQKAIANEIDQTHLANLDALGKGKLDLAGEREKRKLEADKNLNAFREKTAAQKALVDRLKLGLGYDTLASHEKMGAAQMRNALAIVELQSKQANARLDREDAGKLAQLLQQKQHLDQAAAANIALHNQAIQAKMAELDPKTGQPKNDNALLQQAMLGMPEQQQAPDIASLFGGDSNAANEYNQGLQAAQAILKGISTTQAPAALGQPMPGEVPSAPQTAQAPAAQQGAPAIPQPKLAALSQAINNLPQNTAEQKANVARMFAEAMSRYGMSPEQAHEYGRSQGFLR